METTEQQLIRLEEKIDAVYASVEKTRKYVLWMVIGSVLMVVLPVILALMALPMLLSTVGTMYQI
jgi:hypothetical protein